MTKFLQGDGYPTLYRYNASNVLQETITMPYVRDSASSFIKQWFDAYPDSKTLITDLLSGNIQEDKPIGYKWRCEIKYQSISSSDLSSIYNCILNCRENAGHYLKIKPRSDFNVLYKCIYKGEMNIESANSWRHNVVLPFAGMELLSVSISLSNTPPES